MNLVLLKFIDQTRRGRQAVHGGDTIRKNTNVIMGSFSSMRVALSHGKRRWR